LLDLFVGIDPSFSGTGLIILDENTEIISRVLISTKKKDELYDVERRMIEVENQLKFILDYSHLIRGIFIEEISFGSKGQASEQLAALNYHIRIFLYNNKLHFKTISPMGLKKWATGKGNCKKDLMLLKCYKRFGIEFEDDNLCDAYLLARMCFETFKKKEKK